MASPQGGSKHLVLPLSTSLPPTPTSCGTTTLASRSARRKLVFNYSCTHPLLHSHFYPPLFLSLFHPLLNFTGFPSPCSLTLPCAHATIRHSRPDVSVCHAVLTNNEFMELRKATELICIHKKYITQTPKRPRGTPAWLLPNCAASCRWLRVRSEWLLWKHIKLHTLSNASPPLDDNFINLFLTDKIRQNLTWP